MTVNARVRPWRWPVRVALTVLAGVMAAGPAAAGNSSVPDTMAAAAPATGTAATGIPGLTVSWLLPTPIYAPLPAEVSFGPDQDVVLLSVAVTLHAGERRRVFARLDATSNSTYPTLTTAGIVCLDPQDHVLSPSSFIDTNHEGTSGPYDPPGHAMLQPQLLFIAPADGTFTCQLRAETHDSHPHVITAKRGGPVPQIPLGTWLQVSSSGEPDSIWWQAPACSPKGTDPTCDYIDAAHPETDIFLTDGTPLQLWRATDSASQASVMSTVALTTCDGGTSCTSPHTGGHGGSTVTTHLEVRQLNMAGGVCRVTQTPDQTHVLTQNGHHHSIHLTLDSVPVSSTCRGSRLFRVAVHVRLVSGQPVKVDGTTQVDTTEVPTNAIAVSSAFATPKAVPDVHGATEAAARQAIAAAGLTAGNVAYVNSAEPAGTVIDENSPAGTIEPAGSRVDLRVSARMVTVPDVAGDSRITATAALRAAGLAVATVPVTSCVDPDVVTGQQPAGGTVAPQGSVITITIHICDGPPS